MPLATACPHTDRPHKAKGLCRACWGKTRPWGGRIVADPSDPRSVSAKVRYKADPAPRATRAQIVAAKRTQESQADLVLRLLRHAGSSGLEESLARDLGAGSRLAARIGDLKEKGHAIVNVRRPGLPARYVLTA